MSKNKILNCSAPPPIYPSATIHILVMSKHVYHVYRYGSMENDGTANAGTGNCWYWKMPVLENDRTGKCRYWKMPVLENASTGKCRYWKLPVLENAGTGKCRYWKLPVLENAGTGK